MGIDYRGYNDSPAAPSRKTKYATKSDGTDETELSRSIRFNAAGTVSILALDSSSPVAATVFAGETWDIAVLRVNSTGTSLANSDMILFV